jgi:hypothetical protein
MDAGFLFAPREEHKDAAGMATTLRICGIVIIAAVAWAIVGGLLKVTVWELTPLYVGEVLSVWAFGVAWLLKARDLRKALSPPQPARRPAADENNLPQRSESRD